MEISFKRKWICLLMIFSLTFQSCSVYKNKSVTFDEAAAKNYKVKGTRKDGSTNTFDKIEKADTTYYGIQKTDGETARVAILQTDYVKVQPKNKTASTLLTVG